MIRLAPFTPEDFDTFKSWIKNEEELFQFAGPILSFPVTDEQLQNYLEMDHLAPLKIVLAAENRTIGHCELNYENGNHRLSRILIGDKTLRGKKIGEQVVRKMAEIFFLDPTVNEVDLNVFDWNVGAIKCYEKVGFTINHENTDALIVNGKILTRLNMSLKRSSLK